MSTFICFLYIDKEWSQTDDLLLHLLPPSRKHTVESFYYDSDKLLSMYSALLLSYMLETYYQVNDALHCITWIKNRKPQLNTFPNIDFSFSHTKGAILCGITDNNTIGVDIELTNDPPFEIMPLVFHPNEIHYINNSNFSKEQAFFEIWTQKEAYTKKNCTGLSNDIITINTLSPLLVSAKYSYGFSDR